MNADQLKVHGLSFAGIRVRWTTMLAALFFLTTAMRAMLIAVIPLQALTILGTAQGVSIMYFAVGLFGIAATVSLPMLLQRTNTHRVFVLGTVAGMLSPAFTSSGLLWLFVAGMALQVFAVACLELSLSLYVMRQVPKQELGFFEPKRVIFSGSSFMIGPVVGVYLETQVAHWAPYLLTAVLVGLAYLYSLVLGIHSRSPESSQAANHPARYVKRFVEQPRLRLAWAIALARNGWWTIFFIYTPIVAVESGLSEVTAGAIVSAGSLFMYIVPFWGWVGRRYGLRKLLIWGFAATGLLAMFVLVANGVPWLLAVLLIVSAMSATTVDGGGHITFYRAVRASERSEMTGIYLTYRDVSQLVPPGIFSLMLKLLPTVSVFVVAGAWMLSIAYLCRYLPRRLGQQTPIISPASEATGGSARVETTR